MPCILNTQRELMLTRRAKAYSSFCSQTVSLSPAISSQFILGVCAAAEDRKKSIETPYFGSSESFKDTDVDTTEKLVTSACCDSQHAHAYLQPFSRKTGQQR